MSSLNYMILEEFPVIELQGFSKVKDFAYITIAYAGQKLIVETLELPERTNRFRVTVSTGHTIENETLYFLIQEKQADEKRFLYVPATKNYIETDIPV